MSTITVGDNFSGLGTAEQAVVGRAGISNRATSGRQDRRGRDIAILASMGVLQAVWFALLGYAIWAFLF